MSHGNIDATIAPRTVDHHEIEGTFDGEVAFLIGSETEIDIVKISNGEHFGDLRVPVRVRLDAEHERAPLGEPNGRHSGAKFENMPVLANDVSQFAGRPARNPWLHPPLTQEPEH